jgi:hypothetical protein
LPFFEYVWLTETPDPLAPSPKVQLHPVASVDPLPLKAQLNFVQLKVKLATDAAGGGGADEYESL